MMRLSKQHRLVLTLAPTDAGAQISDRMRIRRQSRRRNPSNWGAGPLDLQERQQRQHGQDFIPGQRFKIYHQSNIDASAV